jgi:spore germination cell wall hydrolase CwlJ-like protein
MLNHALMCLATTIYMESAYQPIQAQVAVGYVLMRRADFNKDNVCKEMKRPYQFSWYGKVKPPERLRQEYIDLAWRVMHNLEVDYSYGATHFHDTSIKNPWGMKPIVKWAQLIFYKQGEGKYGRTLRNV